MQKCDGRRGKGEGLLRGMPPPPAATISPGCSRDLGAKLRRLAQSPATQDFPREDAVHQAVDTQDPARRDSLR